MRSSKINRYACKMRLAMVPASSPHGIVATRRLGYLAAKLAGSKGAIEQWL